MIYGCAKCGGDMPENTNLCHCMACHLTFTSIRGFDDHRTGSDSYRVCLSPAQLKRRLYEPNERGAYRVPSDRDFSATEPTDEVASDDPVRTAG